MCGIFGILHNDRAANVDPNRLWAMGQVQRHRGPDAEGYLVDGNVGLGHKRLSIIDLSERGRQPLGNEDGTMWLTCNGEIYNYIELRQELRSAGHVFRSDSDSEVILHLYEEEGIDCIRRLNGMFAFALWDGRNRSLLLARDPIGIKPLYYQWDSESLRFASEAKALVAANGRQAEINPTALADYLTFQFVLGSDTLFAGIHRLMPGELAVVREGSAPAVKQYWRPAFDKAQEHDESGSGERLYSLMEDAVRLQLRSDVPVGSHLSGGIDTASLVCLAARQQDHSIHTYTAGFSEGGLFDDSSFARITATQAGTTHAEVHPDAADFADTFAALMWHLDEPVAGQGSYPQYAVSRRACQDRKVVLGGQGADEIFGGYTRHYLLYLEAALRGEVEGTETHLGLGLADLLPGAKQLRSYVPMMRSFFGTGLFEDDASRYFQLIRRSSSLADMLSGDMLAAVADYDPYSTFRELYEAPGDVEILDKVLNFELTASLPALLQVEDRTSMAWSVESRVPFLDPGIVDFAFSLPAAIKFTGGQTKAVLRRAVADLIPPAISNRRDKLGFPVPLSHWAKGELADWTRDLLLGERSIGRGIFEPQRLHSAIEHGTAFDRSLWAMLCVEMWCQLFVDGDGRDFEAPINATDAADIVAANTVCGAMT
jgi:asparagine synthase (glutamine-hydrolysing)